MQFTLALEQGDPTGELLRSRLRAMAFRNCVPTRLGLHGAGARELLAAPPAWWPAELPAAELDAVGAAETLAALLELEALSEPEAVQPGQLSLLLPGLLKSELDVEQIGSVVVLRSQGHRRLVPLPPALAGKVCSGARLEAGRLELRFG